MTSITNTLREKIKLYIKNGLDISDLIKDISIKGEDLGGAIIKTFNRIEDDMSNCNFSGCIIGEESKQTNVSNSKFINTNFSKAKLLGQFLMRKCDCSGANFSETYMPNLEYQHSKFIEAKFCSSVIRIGSREGLGAEFDKNLWEEITRGWIFK